jgi:Ca2+-binding RTX toxin-like protein
MNGFGHDSVFQVEMIEGTDFDDTLLGDGRPNRFVAGAGDDRIEGRDGDDTLSGDDGDDTLSGDGGDDFVDGGAGTDACDGETEINCEPRRRSGR